MGSVYKAVHPTLNRTVIIKKLTLTGNKDFIERFRREAQLMMEFTNEKIVRVYDHFKAGDAYHIVMEYVDGITLEDLIESKRFLSEEAALLIFSEICQALKYAHDRNVIHRDIKPANILISNSGVVKLVDFGVSTSLDASDEDGLTKAGMTIGTPSYLAPEQISNAKNRDKRSDIYSLGVMLYEMVIGKKPFRGGFNPEVIAMIEKGKYLAPRKINPKIKSSIQRIIKKAMHHKVNRRYQDLGLVVKKVSRYLKRYKTEEQIQQTIKTYLEGKEDPFQQKKGLVAGLAGKLVMIGLILSIVICSVTLGVFWGTKKGLQYEWFYPDQYGSMQILVKIRKSYKSVQENYVNASLFEEKDNSLSLVKDVAFEFKEVKELESNSYYALMSQKVYLPQHLYKLVLYAENEQYRENFFLYPRSLQKKTLSTSESLKVSFKVDREIPELPVKADCSIYAIHTNEAITAQSEISVLSQSEWKDWSDFAQKEKGNPGFISGHRYRIRFKHPDYYTKYYNLTIRPEQTKVSLKINLIPVPATVYLSSNLKGTQLTINDSEYYQDGSRNRLIKKIPVLSGSKQKILLSPGDYILSAESGKLFFGAEPANETLSVKSGDEIHLSVNETPQNKNLQFKYE